MDPAGRWKRPEIPADVNRFELKLHSAAVIEVKSGFQLDSIPLLILKLAASVLDTVAFL